MLNKLFLPSLWILSLITAVLLTILTYSIREKYKLKESRAFNYAQFELKNLDSYRFFLENTVADQRIEAKDKAVIDYGLKIVQTLEEICTLSPYQVVRDTARYIQKQYLARFPMLQNRIVKMAFETGDIILRHNNDFHSNLCRDLSKGEKIYSHAGIIDYLSPDSIMVYHATASDFTGIGGIIDTRIYDFIPKGGFDIGVYRLDLPKEKRIAIVNQSYESQKSSI